MRKKIKLFSCEVDNLTLFETLCVIEKSIDAGEHLIQSSINAAKIVKMNADPALREAINISGLINADGISIVWASKILGKPLKARVTGIDLMYRLINISFEKKYKIYFLGATDEVVSRVVNKVASIDPDVVAGFNNGYFNEYEEKAIVKKIVKTEPDILFIALPTPEKELFIYRNRDDLKCVKFILGVGGSFDVYSGKVKRAPKVLQNLGLEWFYRFIQEPKKMWRRAFIDNLLFLWLLIREI